MSSLAPGHITRTQLINHTCVVVILQLLIVSLDCIYHTCTPVNTVHYEPVQQQYVCPIVVVVFRK